MSSAYTKFTSKLWPETSADRRFKASFTSLASDGSCRILQFESRFLMCHPERVALRFIYLAHSVESPLFCYILILVYDRIHGANPQPPTGIALPVIASKLGAAMGTRKHGEGERVESARGRICGDDGVLSRGGVIICLRAQSLVLSDVCSSTRRDTVPELCS